jgi:hypothetical protein
VEAEVELLVVDPERRGEMTGHHLDALPVARHEGDPVADQVDQPRVVEARVARFEDLDGGVVRRRLRRLGGQERQVSCANTIDHDTSPPSATVLVDPTT